MKPNTIALSVLTPETRYIDLSQYTDDVTLTGYYRGDRIVFKNAKNKVLRLENATIESTHAEDALVFDGAERVKLHSDAESRIVGGGVTMWGDIKGISLLNLNIMYAHTGIRYTQPTATAKGIEITECYILAPMHEGIYIGSHEAQEYRTEGVFIRRNTITNAGWDGIQAGNCVLTISDNTVDGYGLRRNEWQGKGIMINPNCIGHIHGNDVENGVFQRITVLNSNVFINY
jgi:hypothetical protein